MKLVKTLGFYHSVFFEIQIVDTRKPVQTRIGISSADDGR
jgi:putative hemolysin